MASEASTRNQEVHDSLRDDILHGRWKPGQRLGFSELGATYNASVGVTREALARLVEQGLVESRPQQGFYVTEMSASRLINLTELRCIVETEALKNSIAQGSLAWESEVLATSHRLEKTPMSMPSDPNNFSSEWVSLHAAYHQLIISGGSNDMLVSLAGELGRAVQVYCWWLTHIPEPGTRDIVREHREISEAIIARDSDLAVSLLVNHIRLTADNMLNDEGSLKPLEVDESQATFLGSNR